MKRAVDALIIVLGALLVAIGFNTFLIPHELLSGGVSGVAMLVGYIFTQWNISLLYLIFNLPIMIWGLVVMGKRFVIYSIAAVLFTFLFMQWVPTSLYVRDPILASVFGGVIVGIGSGITLRIGGSSGGFDIVGSILTRNRDFPLGTVLFALNGVVIVLLGYLKNNWDLALCSMLAIFISGKVVDMIHIRHVKVTAFIVTRKREEMAERLLKIPRGVTVMRSEGAFTQNEHYTLMTVVTRYELAELKKIIRAVDSKAFVNIVETVSVWGEFRRAKQ
ncbi:YitT family protein [Paenibacillus chartarius]|uniref:YitT family protein n=1 Tax=Paenibacillus chartarius TaxID=747481 RepID=A0ABV6DMB4_9BACL